MPGNSGRPLPEPIRMFFESHLGRGLNQVRVHTGEHAAEAASSIGARAYTIGQDIVFGSREYAPESETGQRLLAHEIVHTIQQSEAGASDTLHRDPLDPANTKAWDWYDSEKHRKDPSFLQTVGAASGAASNLTKTLATAEPPKTDAEREAFENQVLALIRLNAVALVGAHRSELAQKKKQFEDMAAAPPPGPGSADSGSNPKAADTAAAIRGAATTVESLNSSKSQLEDLRDAIAGAVRVNAGPEAINDEYQTLWDNAQPNSTPFALQRLLGVRNTLRGGGLSWGSKKVVLMELGNDLRNLREKQIQGIDLSLALTYNSFPFLADLPASYILTSKQHTGTTGKVMAFGLALGSLVNTALAPFAIEVAHDTFKKDAPPDDQTLLLQVGASFDRLLGKTDEAIVKVGSGSIHPLDLPGAVATTRNGLAPPLRTELDRIQQDHEAAKFARDMILALGMAVLTGITGGLAGIGFAAAAAAGGVAAAGIGVAQLGMQLKDMLDRQTLAAASTSPDGSLLGVSSPSVFEWTMFAVGAVLTAADLAALAKEIGSLHPAFSEQPHVSGGKAEPHPAAKPEGEPHPGAKAEAGAETGAQHPADVPTAGELATPPGKVQPANPAEARILEAGRGDAVPTPEQIESELSVVQRSKAQKIPGKEYVEEVELPNGHTWRRTPDGHWCRFSNGGICVPGASPAPARQTVASLEDIEKLVEPLRPKIESPPPSVKTPQDQSMWELYNEYFSERVASMRADLEATGQTKREVPRDFDSFRKQYTENPELIKALRGRLAQGGTGAVIHEITEGKVAGNLGISKVAEPGPGEVVYPDFVWSGQRGYTAVSSKSRDFRGMSTEQVQKTVATDIDEALGKYFGSRYVRRPGLDVTGQQIQIDEVVLNYDPRLVPESMRANIRAYAKTYGGAGVQIGFFGF